LFSQGTPVSSTNKTYCYNITEISLRVALNTTTQTLNHMITHLVKKLFLVIIVYHGEKKPQQNVKF
jgi:hypothetical protein